MTDSHSIYDDSPLLTGASDALKTLLDQGLTQLSLKRGETLFDQGDHDDRLYILDRGLLEVSVLSAAGKKLSLNQLREGSVFGEIAIFDPGPRTATIEALEASTLRAIRHTKLMHAIADQPDLVEEMLRLAGRRMRWMSRQMEDQVFLPPSARLAGKLLYLKGAGDTIGMSQAQLADYVGVTREVVSKTLAEWRRDGILDVTRGKITVLDEEALDDIKSADFV